MVIENALPVFYTPITEDKYRKIYLWSDNYFTLYSMYEKNGVNDYTTITK